MPSFPAPSSPFTSRNKTNAILDSSSRFRASASPSYFFINIHQIHPRFSHTLASTPSTNNNDRRRHLTHSLSPTTTTTAAQEDTSSSLTRA
jgi:hypothetical protein